MQVKLLAFAQSSDLLGWRELTIDVAPDETPRMILNRLAPHFHPESARVAVDQEYHHWDHPIGTASEIALIPPVSGG